MPQATTETSARTPLAPVSSGYADVNGIKLYHEIYGQGGLVVKVAILAELSSFVRKPTNVLKNSRTQPRSGCS
jgi:hypothetical protein